MQLSSPSYAHLKLPLRWYSVRRFSSLLAGDLYSWLAEPGSLTQRLKVLAGGDFAVKVTDEYWGKPRPDEVAALGMVRPVHVFIREVELWGKGECWVKARTLIPQTSLCGPLAALRGLGTKPLGAKLFSLPMVERGTIEVTRVADQQAVVWARRSVFRLQQKPLLVTELFMPSLLQVE